MGGMVGSMKIVKGNAKEIVKGLTERFGTQFGSKEMERLRIRFDVSDPSLVQVAATWSNLETAKNNLTKVEQLIDEVGGDNVKRIGKIRLLTSKIP